MPRFPHPPFLTVDPLPIDLSDKPPAQHRIRPICDISPAMDTQIHTGSGGAKGPRAQPLDFALRHPDIRHGLHSFDDYTATPPLCVLVSRRPSDILFHDQQDSGHRCLNRSRTLWSGLFYVEHSCLHRPLLPLSYSTIRRVVVATGASGPHIIQYARAFS